MTEELYLIAVKKATASERVAEVCSPLISQVIIWAIGQCMARGEMPAQPISAEQVCARTAAACDRISNSSLEAARIMGESVVQDYIGEKRRINAAALGDRQGNLQRDANGES